MTEIFVSLEQAAQLEGIQYKTMSKRIISHPEDYITREKPRPGGGKPLVTVALSSLSKKARKAYKAAQKVDGGDAVQANSPNGQSPWYVEVDFHWFVENHQTEYYQKVELKNHILEFLEYDDADRTAHAEEFAGQLGISSRTLYRYAKDVLEAGARANQREAETGRNHDYYQVLCLCRKPRDAQTFPSLSDEMKIKIENIYFNNTLRQNLSTKKDAYDKLVANCKLSGIEPPSYQMVARYIKFLVDKPGGESVKYLAEKGEREWKNKFMYKGMRDLTQLEVMETVISDEHRFDLNVSYTPPNGIPIAIHPIVIAFIDAKSRNLVGYGMVRYANAQDIKSCYAKVSREHGVSKVIHIDNGKDYVADEMIGYNADKREAIDAEMQGFYHAMGVKTVHRSTRYEPWDKGPMERFFGTVCQQFSKWFDSYVGTLTGSKTYNKVQKDIPKLLKQGRLFTLEEFYDLFDLWINENYSQNMHRGLKDSGEEYTTPAALFQNAERYYQAPPPDSYITMLLMKGKDVSVRATGIRFDNRRYQSDDLMPYINSHINIRYMPDDESHIFAFSKSGELIGEIPLAEKLNPRPYADKEQMVDHKTKQKRHLKDVRNTLNEYRTPFEEKEENDGITPHLVGGLDLTKGKKPDNNVVSLPKDKQYRQTQSKKKNSQPNPFIDDLADNALERLERIRKAQ